MVRLYFGKKIFSKIKNLEKIFFYFFVFLFFLFSKKSFFKKSFFKFYFFWKKNFEKIIFYKKTFNFFPKFFYFFFQFFYFRKKFFYEIEMDHKSFSKKISDRIFSSHFYRGCMFLIAKRGGISQKFFLAPSARCIFGCPFLPNFQRLFFANVFTVWKPAHYTGDMPLHRFTCCCIFF